MNQKITILRKHTDRLVSVDSCRIHGIGFTKCRVCLKSDRVGDAARSAKHRADVETLVGFPRMASM